MNPVFIAVTRRKYIHVGLGTLPRRDSRDSASTEGSIYAAPVCSNSGSIARTGNKVDGPFGARPLGVPQKDDCGVAVTRHRTTMSSRLRLALVLLGNSEFENHVSEESLPASLLETVTSINTGFMSQRRCGTAVGWNRYLAPHTYGYLLIDKLE